MERRLDVNDDPVAVAHQPNRSTVESFWRDVADAESVRTPAKATVGDESAVRAASDTLHRARHREHLAHAGAALRALVANDHDRARLDLVRHDREHRLVLTVKDPRRTVEVQLVHARRP